MQCVFFAKMRMMSVGIEHIDETPRPGKLRELVSKLLFAAVGYHFVYAYVVDAAINKWGMQTADNAGGGRLLWLIGFGGTVDLVVLYWLLNILTILLYFFRSSLRGGFAEGAAMGALVSVVWFICDWIMELIEYDSASGMDWIRYMFLIPINIGMGCVCGMFVERIPLSVRQGGELGARVIVFAFVVFCVALGLFLMVDKLSPLLFGWPAVAPGNITHIVAVGFYMMSYFAAGIMYFRAPREKGGTGAGLLLGLLFAAFGLLYVGISRFDSTTTMWALLFHSLGIMPATILAGALAKKL